MFSDQAVTRGPNIKLLQRQGVDTYTVRLLNVTPSNMGPAYHWCSWPHREEHGFCRSWEE